MTKPSSPALTAVHVVCHTRLMNTITSAWTATTRIGQTPLADADQLCRFAQVGDFRVGLLLAGLERLLGAVDPDHRDLLLQAGLDVVVVAGRDVHPTLLATNPPLALGEVRRVRLVGTDLLGGHDEVEVERDVAARLAQELVVD